MGSEAADAVPVPPNEMLDLENTINTFNEMIRDLRHAAPQEAEGEWRKADKDRLTRLLQGQRDVPEAAATVLLELAPLVSAQYGVFYSMTTRADGEEILQLEAAYGHEERRDLSTVRIGQGLVGRCAKEKKRILLTGVLSTGTRINSHPSALDPPNVIALPVLFEGSVRAVIKLSSWSPFSVTHQTFLDHLPESIGQVLNAIEANLDRERIAITRRASWRSIRPRRG
jgi:hypothetical protein